MMLFGRIHACVDGLSKTPKRVEPGLDYYQQLVSIHSVREFDQFRLRAFEGLFEGGGLESINSHLQMHTRNKTQIASPPRITRLPHLAISM